MVYDHFLELWSLSLTCEVRVLQDLKRQHLCFCSIDLVHREGET